MDKESRCTLCTCIHMYMMYKCQKKTTLHYDMLIDLLIYCPADLARATTSNAPMFLQATSNCITDTNCFRREIGKVTTARTCHTPNIKPKTLTMCVCEREKERERERTCNAKLMVIKLIQTYRDSHFQSRACRERQRRAHYRHRR